MTKIKIKLKGGKGSGHHGHRGRIGKVGGSIPGKYTFSGYYTWQDENVEHIPKQMENRGAGILAESAGDVFRESTKRYVDWGYIEEKLTRIERNIGDLLIVDVNTRNALNEIANLFRNRKVPSYLKAAKALNISIASGNEMEILQAIEDVRAGNLIGGCP